MIDIGVPETLLAATIKLIVAQRLLRRVCTHCRKTRLAQESDRDVFVSVGLHAPESLATQAGCDRCDQTGYTGRFPVFEIFNRFDAPGNGLGSSAPADALLRNALERVEQLDTTLEEAISQCPMPSPDEQGATS
jgi:general secretion pathway protein E